MANRGSRWHLTLGHDLRSSFSRLTRRTEPTTGKKMGKEAGRAIRSWLENLLTWLRPGKGQQGGIYFIILCTSVRVRYKPWGGGGSINSQC